MTRLIANVVLIMLLVGVIVLTVAQRADYTKRNLQYFPGMVEAVAYDPQAPCAARPDGKIEQAPDGGTEAQGYVPFGYALSPEESARAGRELRNPFLRDSAAELARGQMVFETYCRPCHGPGGQGDGLIPQHGFPPPPSLLAEHARGMEDGRLYYTITMGQNNMPSLAAQVTREDRWRAVLYIGSLQATPAADTGHALKRPA